jgi:hypothetical protein
MLSIRACRGPEYVESDPPAMQFTVALIAADDSYYDSATAFPARRRVERTGIRTLARVHP